MSTGDKTRQGASVAALSAALLGMAWSPAAAAQDLPPAAAAQEPPPAAAAQDLPPPPREEDLAIAKDLFRKGVALFNTGDDERALDYFLRSRAAVPSSKNTTNAAICLDRLGRYDEALDLYEDLLLRFAAELDAEDRENLGPAMAALRTKVGALRVLANVDGRLVIDGRARANLPLSAPLRVLGGKHTVRIFKDGYTAFESRVDVPVGQTLTVETRLSPLADTGILRVEDPASEGFDVIVDGANKGKIPWEEPLPPGRHLVWIQRGDRGSMPKVVEILLGQTALARLEAAELGPPLQIEVAPETARITLDGVPLGAHAWRGRVPLGTHRVSLVEEGYLREEIAVAVTSDRATPAEIRVKLRVDGAHPRWPRPAVGRFFADAFGGLGGGPSLGNGALPDERALSSGSVPLAQVERLAPDASLAALLGLRGGYRFTTGLAVELSGGYLTFGATPQDLLIGGLVNAPIQYTVSRWIRARGGFVGLGGSYRASILSWLGFSARLTGGIASLAVTDTLTGFAADADADPRLTQPPLSVDAQYTGRERPVFVMPELGLDVTFQRFFAGLSLGLAWFPGAGPVTTAREIGVTPRCAGTDDLNSVACAPNARLSAERVYGGFVLFLPQISAGVMF